MAIPIADPLLMMEDALRDLHDFAQTVEAGSSEGRRINKVIVTGAVSRDSYLTYMRKCFEQQDRDFRESLERFRKQFETMLHQVQRVSKYVLHRAQGRSSGAGKSAAKKSASASSGGGGDGSGDGDGPARTRSKSKKSRSLKVSKTPTKHPPRSSPGAISIPSPQHSPPPSRSQGMAQLTLLYAINCILIVVLLAMGERELASIALGSGSLSALLNHQKKDKPDKKD